MPPPWDKLDGLERLVLLRCFRLDRGAVIGQNTATLASDWLGRVALAVRKYIESRLGPSFTEIPPFDLSVRCSVYHVCECIRIV